MVMIQMDYSEPYADPVVYNSYVFHSKTQQPDEPFDNYLTAITELAKLCEFESLEERMIRDKIIVGVNCSSLRDTLLKLKDPKLNNIIEFCRLIEKEKSEKKDRGKTVYQFRKRIIWEKKLVGESENGDEDSGDKENLNTENVEIPETDPLEDEITIIDVKQEEMEDEINYEPDFVHFDEGVEDNLIDQSMEGTEIKIEPISNYEQHGVEASIEGDLSSAINKNFIKLQNVFSLKSGNHALMTNDAQETNLENNFYDHVIKDVDLQGTSDSNIFHAKCNNCTNQFHTMEDLEAHVVTCQNQIPNIFNGNNFKMMINKNFQFIKKNLDITQPDDCYEKSFGCDICMKRFRRRQSLKLHQEWHKNDGRYKCEVCGKAFKFPSELKQHSLVHTDEKPCKCKECNAAFKNQKTLRSHLSVHTGERPFKCEVCEKTFTRKFYLDAHAIVHTGKKPFQCQGCNKGFGDITSLKRHVLTHTREKPYKCNVCERNFREKGALRKHILTHSANKPYRCEDCGKTYAQKANLKTHSIVHTGEKPFKCLICNTAFRDNAGLKSHSYKHSGETPFKCDQCAKAYRDKATLSKHLIVHMEESPYKCKVCNRTFRGRNSLKLHLYIHTGEKPYVCNDCGRAFRSKSTMKEHMYRIHKNIHISKKKKRYKLRKTKVKSYNEIEEEEEEGREVKEENDIDVKEEEYEVEEHETMEMDEGLIAKIEEDDG